MRVFFIGSVDFSRKMLEVLVEMEELTIVGIATKSKSSFNSDHTDLLDIANSHGIPYMHVKDINASHVFSWIRSLNPNLVFCFGWSSLIKKDLLQVPDKGVIGYHPTKLPQNRGRHPIVWALALGLNETASTFFRMDEGADTGDILDQRIVSIGKKDDAQSLYDKLVYTARQQLHDFVPQLKYGTAQWIQQNGDDTNVWRKRNRVDGEIDFRMSSDSIHNLVRALTKPYVGAHLKFHGEEVKVWSSEIGPLFPKNLEPGKVLNISKDNQILIKTADASIWIKEHEFKTIPVINTYIL